MKINEANIDIVRKSGQLKSVAIQMPIWDKSLDDESISINLPLLGLKTFAFEDSDTVTAIQELIQAFCINCEKFGHGLEAELSKIGWVQSAVDVDKVRMSFQIQSSNVVLDQIMQTGDQFVEVLQIAY